MPINPSLIYQKYAGQSLSYDGIPANRGQCVQWAEYVLTDSQYGYSLSPFYGNAIDWWNNFSGVLSKNFDKITDGSIKAGDFVIFNQNVGSVYGHIDMALHDGTVDNYLGADSNWAGNMTVHQVQHSGRQYIIGSLRLKGQQPQGDTMNAATVESMYQNYGVGYGRNDIEYFTGRSADELEPLLNKNPQHVAHVQTFQLGQQAQAAGWTPGTQEYIPYSGNQLYTKKG